MPDRLSVLTHITGSREVEVEVPGSERFLLLWAIWLNASIHTEGYEGGWEGK